MSLAAIGLLSVSGCTALQPAPPDGFDLSGEWTLNPAYSDTAPHRGRHDGSAPMVIRPARGGAPPGGHGSPSTGGGRGHGLFAVRPDLAMMRAERLTIRQSEDSLGIWIPGEPLRDVSWGKVERGAVEIEAGWDDTGALVVRSKADGGSLTERYVLSVDGAGLTVEISFDPKRGRSIELIRYFDRSPGTGDDTGA